MNKNYKTLEQSNSAIFKNIKIGNYAIVHLKNTMEPMIFEHDTKKLYNPPEGYIKFDNDNYRRKFAV